MSKIGITNEKISGRGGLSLFLRYFEKIGGYIENDYSKTPSSGLYKINLKEFSKTKKNNLKHFN